MLDKAPSTVKAYKTALKQWQRWATELKLPTLPAKAPIWPWFSCTWHKRPPHGQPRHSQSPHYGGCTKKPTSPTRQATPESNSYAKPCVASMVDRSTASRHSALCSSRKSFHAWRVTPPPPPPPPGGYPDRSNFKFFNFVLGFCGFLRWDDMKALKRDSLEFCDTHMTIHFGKRKNYQLRNCDDLLIARAPEKTAYAQ